MDSFRKSMRTKS